MTTPRIDVLVPVSDVFKACDFYAGLIGLTTERAKSSPR